MFSKLKVRTHGDTLKLPGCFRYLAINSTKLVPVVALGSWRALAEPFATPPAVSPGLACISPGRTEQRQGRGYQLKWHG